MKAESVAGRSWSRCTVTTGNGRIARKRFLILPAPRMLPPRLRHRQTIIHKSTREAATRNAASRNVPEPGRIVRSAVSMNSGRSIVLIQESTETLATANLTHALRRRRTVDEFVPEPLVIALAMSSSHPPSVAAGEPRRNRTLITRSL